MQNQPTYFQPLRQAAGLLLPALLAIVSAVWLLSGPLFWADAVRSATDAPVPNEPPLLSPKEAVSLSERVGITAPLEQGFGWQSNESDQTFSVAWGDVDADGDLDLAVADGKDPNKLYLNEGGRLTVTASWQSNDSHGSETGTISVAWGDVDGDGDLDLAVGNGDLDFYLPDEGEPNTLYLNEGGRLTSTTSWQSNESDSTQSVAWGDVDADGDLDLAVGNYGEQNRLYLNEGTMLSSTAIWQSDERDATYSVAWGDVDGDGDLDLAVGNWAGRNKLYLNEGGSLSQTASWQSNDSDGTRSVAWGDVDADGDLDLAVGNDGPNRLYLNQGTMLSSTASWRSSESDQTFSVAWGDMDGDGDLDLAVGNDRQPNKFYLNEGEMLTSSATAQSNDSDRTRSVAWGDVDADGDLDLAVGNIYQPNKLYLNNWAALISSATAQSNERDYTRSVAWGDVDADGDLDLAVGNDSDTNKLYLNNGATLSLSASWQSNERDKTESVAWGDVNGDGALDLAVGNYAQPNKLYLNNGPTLSLSPIWQSNDSDKTLSVAWGDVDGDGDLDLAVGNGTRDLSPPPEGQPNKLYLNEGGRLTITASWQSDDSDATHSVAWGDVDGDGDLDLAVGNWAGRNKLYLNEGGSLSQSASWQSNEQNDGTYSVAWGDVDGDGDLDLAVGNYAQPNKLYLNEGGSLSPSAHWQSNDSDNTLSVAWGDVDGDGDFDLAVGNNWQPNKLYLNEGGSLSQSANWQSNESDRTESVAWGDVDGDGALELAVGNWMERNRIYMSQWPAHPLHPPQSVALEMSTLAYAPANFYALPEIRERVIPITYTLSNPAATPMREVRASYSPDGGGRWLPAVGSSDTITTNLATGFSISSSSARPIGENGTLSSTLTFNNNGQVDNLEVGLTISHTNASQLAAALYTPWPAPTGTTVLLFDGAGGEARGFKNLTLSDQARDPISMATGIVHTTTSIISEVPFASTDVPRIIPLSGIVTSTLLITQGPAVITDVNVVNLNGTHTWINDLQFALRSPAGTQVLLMNRSCSDQDNFNLTLDDEAAPGNWPCPPTDGGRYRPFSPLSAFDGEASNGTWTLLIQDTVAPDGGSLQGWGLAFNSQLGFITTTLPIEGSYQPVEPLASLRGAPVDSPFTLMITDRTASGVLENWQLKSIYEHVYEWDVLASEFFGQSDNVVFRLEGLPNLKPITRTIPGPFQRPIVSAQSYPFRVRGNQVRVYTNTITSTNGLANALVYRLPANQTTGAKPYANHADQPFRTDEHGYLQGWGELAISDQLFALLPITSTDHYTLYHTSATPTETGLSGATVNEFGVQELVVSADNPLLLFDLDLSLEWDARNDGTFLTDLEEAIQRASDVLYDVSNGQVALGNVRVHQAKENWLTSNVVMYATNNIRPRANMGGIVSSSTADIGLTGPIENAYLPGQVRMGPNWDPFGENHLELGQDWWRALAHELAHYLLFLPDNYVGISENGHLIALDCQGSFMTNTYDDDYSEFLTDEEWKKKEDCQKTIAAKTTGRSDWETIKTFYPMIDDRGGNSGPSIRLLEVTQVSLEPLTDTTTLPARYFDLRGAEDSALLPLPQAVGYLFKTRGTSDLTDDIVVPLGSTGANGDRIKVRGAEVNDRVCVFESSSRRVGCETVTESNVSLSLREVSDWQPEILVTPVSSRTFAITVTQSITSGQLNVQVLPATGSPITPTLISAPWDEMIPVSPTNPLTFTQLITLPYPAFEAFVRVWVPESTPKREAISQFYLSAAWGPAGRGALGNLRPWEANARAWTGNTRAWGAPVASGDGQVTIFNTTDPFSKTGTSALQALTTLPHLPSWLTLVGQGYQVSLLESSNVTRTISFDYLQRDVPDGYEHTLSIYYSPDGRQSWERLLTKVDREENLATTRMPTDGAGIYALIATLVMPAFQPGWNQFGYPLSETHPPSTTLASIKDSYTSVYFYEPTTSRWRLYDKTVVDNHAEFTELVNDLTEIEFGQSYWLYATEPITLYLGVPSDNLVPSRAPSYALPPATFYGPISPAITSTVGMPITATINGAVCGQSTVDEQGVYKIQVAADTGNGCGVSGRSIVFRVGDQPSGTRIWNNSQAWYHPLGPTNNRLYLPMIQSQ